MDIAIELIDSMLVKFKSERKWTLQAIAQLSEEDICWSPNTDSNSIANLVAHIYGCVHSRIETIFFNIPDSRNRDKEFERGLAMSVEEAYEQTKKAFDTIIDYLEHLHSNPDLLLSQPFLDRPPLTYSQVNNETTVLNLMIAMVREVHYHTGQIIYAAKIRKGQLEWQYD
ncbi:DinB family protein [Paenibacillus gorillae]|uniref:DinB family protein n=1 Tax=Paenibacillus gorillae TaxID=1243662 RepID=UPI0004B86A0F|nr:DinB family protein [Paenibacillus gorillae]